MTLTSLKYEFEALADLMIDDKKTKDLLIAKNCVVDKTARFLKFYPVALYN